MGDQQYIYRGVAGFDGGGAGGVSSLGTPWMGSVQEVEKFAKKYFSTVPTTWYVNRENSGEAGKGVQNVHQFTIKPEETLQDTYVLLREDLTFVATAASIEELHRHVTSTGRYTSNLRLEIYRAPKRNAALQYMELVESFTPNDLKTTWSNLKDIDEDDVVEYLESKGYTVSKKR